MSFDELLRARRLTHHEPNASEIEALLKRVQRDVHHARVSSDSEDWRFIAAYSAALALATIVVAASGFRARGAGHHVTIMAALPAALGDEATEMARYLNECRDLRNALLYDEPGPVTPEQVARLIAEAERLRECVLAWLEEHHPDLLPE